MHPDFHTHSPAVEFAPLRLDDLGSPISLHRLFGDQTPLGSLALPIPSFLRRFPQPYMHGYNPHLSSITGSYGYNRPLQSHPYYTLSYPTFETLPLLRAEDSKRLLLFRSSHQEQCILKKNIPPELLVRSC